MRASGAASIKDGVTLGGTRLGGIYRMPGGELAKVAEAVEGDVVALGRLDGVPTGATVSPGGDAGAVAVPRPRRSRSTRWRSRPPTTRTM